MERRSSGDGARQRPGYLGLAGLVLGLALGALALYTVAGPPHLPQQLPGWDAVALTLRGSYLPPEAVGYILTMGAWAVWLWIVASLVFRLAVLGAETVTGGAPWIARLRATSDRVTLPIVRRLVDGALVAIVVVNLVGRSTPSAAADVTTSTPPATVVAIREEAPPQPDFERQQVQAQQGVEYTVQAGDTLWGIAERFYGTGHEYPRILAENVGRQMPDGRRFTQAGVIYPGWVLLIHPANRALDDAGRQAYYTVAEGDTLRGIAARLLNDESRWPEIYELNAGTVRLEDGHVLKDPGLIWPGLRLQLPSSSPADEEDVPVSEPAAPPAEESVTPTATPIAEAQPMATPESYGGEVAADDPAVALTPSPLVYGAAGLAATVAAGGAMILARRRARRSLSEPPVRIEADLPLGGDFAQAEFARSLTHRLHGREVEPVVLIAEQVLRFLEEQGVPEASVVMAQQGRNATTLTLSVGLLDQTRVLNLAGELGARLGGTGQSSLTPDRDVAIQLSGLKLAGLIAPPSRTGASSLRLLPMGVLSRDQTLYANWRELGHILVAGLPAGGTDIVMTSLISALAAACHPKELRLWTIADRRLLAARLLQLPHQNGALIDPADEAEVSRVLELARTELMRRMRESDGADAPERAFRSEEPDIVLAIGELQNLKDDGSTLELIGVHGPAHGIRLLATTTSPVELEVDLLAHFQTRLVLQTLDDEESIRLLGRPEAADLGIGDLLLRIDRRTPVRARGFRVSPDRLDQMVRLMGEAYGCRAPAAIAKMDAPEENEGGARPAAATQEEDEPPNGQGEDTVAGNVGAVAAKTPSDEDGTKPEVSSLLQISCFGEFAVRSGDREITPTSEEGASFKAWEVLAFLAAQPDGAVSREKLLAAVWPDVDAERAGNRMRVAMVRLRALLARQVPGLPPEAVRADRDGTCRLDTTLISSDVHQFVALCRAAPKLPPDDAKLALQQALALYGGDLLPGRGTRLYEWVDERDESGISLRESYREEYYRATQRLAKLFCGEGRADLAVPLYKVLLKAEPTLEDIVREVYRCYQQLGDLSLLIREDRHLRQALREAYYDPGFLPGSFQKRVLFETRVPNRLHAKLCILRAEEIRARGHLVLR